MPSLKYTPSDYRSLLQMTSTTHLLVEGSSDKRVFMLLFDAIHSMSMYKGEFPIVDIDTAESLIQFDELPKAGNRDKVELICQSVIGSEAENKLAGFVDREFRDFNLQPNLADNISGHKVNGRLVWSRGHSIENYLFEFIVLHNPLRDFSETEYYREALNTFEFFFDDILIISCALSLAAYEIDAINRVIGTINRGLFDLTDGSLVLDRIAWRELLLSRAGFSNLEVNDLIKQYDKFVKKLPSEDINIVRWLVHGHLGFQVFWIFYSYCVYHVFPGRNHSKKQKEAQKVMSAKLGVRFNRAASSWVGQFSNDYDKYPIDLLNLLGIDVTDDK